MRTNARRSPVRDRRPRVSGATIRVDRDGTTMNPALRERCAAIQASLVQAASDDVQTRHRVGQLLVDTRKKAQVYGANAMRHLSAALHRPVSTLYRYAFVAQCWSGREMKALVARLNALGEPLSWSHWVELAQVRSREARDGLLARALQEGLSVRQLAREVRRLRPGRSEPSRDRELAAEVEAAVRSCERWSGQALAAAQAIAALLATAERANPALLAQLQRTLRAYETARERSDEALRVLRAALGALPAQGAVATARPPRLALAAGTPERGRPTLMIAGMRP